MERFPHGGCNWEGCKECFPPERNQRDKLKEVREIIARMKQNHGIATHKGGSSWPTGPLDAVNYFALGGFAKDSWRLQELVSWLDEHGQIGYEPYKPSPIVLNID